MLLKDRVVSTSKLAVDGSLDHLTPYQQVFYWINSNRSRLILIKLQPTQVSVTLVRDFLGSLETKCRQCFLSVK